MKKVLSEISRIPIKMWLDDVEGEAMKKIVNLGNLPFAFHHVAIMPDCHKGYGMPIGGVLATKKVIIPNAVGVDIGCGMCAVQTSLNSISKESLTLIVEKIRERIPVGFDHHQEAQDNSLMPQENILEDMVVFQHYTNARKQLGTLGGGNHFIEIQKDNFGFTWIMIHSGSRNLGKQVADHYNKIAIKLNERWFSSVPKHYDLAFLPIESDEAKDYMREMQYCVDFAYANRKLMIERIMEIFDEVIPGVMFPTLRGETITNIAHNYARWENHFGENVIVHRKGATSAKFNEIGIIPGSQGTSSYIVYGHGNAESFMSCSHGAGRKMSRTKAQNELFLEDEIIHMNEQGIIHGIRSLSDLDEAPGAYKDIDEVINNQLDLIEPLIMLKPIAVIKG